MLGNNIHLSYQSSIATNTEMMVSLQMPNSLGFVEHVRLLLNRYGETAGSEAELIMPFDDEISCEDYSVFKTSMSFSEVGYRTFCLKLFLDGQEQTVTWNVDTDEGVLSENENYWEIYVYENGFGTPDEVKSGIMYQVYCDTFNSKDLPEAEKAKTVPWDTPIQWEPDSEGEYHNNQFFGGNLQGIIDKINYFVSLGVKVLYLTPIFQSSSSHRYDTDDYDKIDSMIGDWDLLETLQSKLKDVGILLVLDLVLNHSGINNLLIVEHPEMYYWENSKPKGWMDYKTLPEFNKQSELYFALLDRVLSKCAKYCYGVRLDVADYMPDFVLEKINMLRKKHKIKYMIGEVWDFAVDKGRGFLNGRELDGVMNYRMGNAILWFAVTGNTYIFNYMVSRMCRLYPKEALAASPIFFSSHDTPRLSTSLVGEFMKKDEVNCENCHVLNFWDVDKHGYWWKYGQFNTYKFRKWEAEHDFLPADKVKIEYELYKLAVFLQYTLPGMPAIFAGDEMGVWGYKDPHNRKPLPWNNINRRKQRFSQIIGEFHNRYIEIFANPDNFKIVYAKEQGRLVYRWKNMLFIVNQRSEPWKVDVNLSQSIFATSQIEDDRFLSPRSAIALDYNN